jgi:hypothetical protein
LKTQCPFETMVLGPACLVLAQEHTVVPQTNFANLELDDDLVPIVAAGPQTEPVHVADTDRTFDPLVQVQAYLYVRVLTPPTGCKASTCLRLHRSRANPALMQAHSIDCTAWTYWKPSALEENADVHIVRLSALVDLVQWSYKAPGVAAVGWTDLGVA